MKIKGQSNGSNNNNGRIRIIALMIAAFLIMSAFLTSCGGDDKPSQTTGAQTSAATAAKTETQSKTEATKSDDGLIEVPDVIGKPEEEAVSLLQGLGFEVQVSRKGSNEYAKGLVFKTDRTVGEKLKKGDRVFLYVSKGEASSVDIPKTDPLVEARGKKEQGANKDYVPINYEIMKAMWLSQFDLNQIYCNGTTQRSEKDFTDMIKTVMKNVKSAGCNTVIIQLRPNADSIYPSEYYPWSKYAVGVYGLYGDYDPLSIMIKEAHALDISVQGWVNPLRGFDTGTMKVINAAYPMKQWYNDQEKKNTYIYLLNGTYYLNPAYKEVRDLIVNGAAEIVRYYDIDGIHMDDYFYPSEVPDEFDAKAFDESDFMSLRLFRQENISLLLSEMYSAIKAENPNVIYGISPMRNIWMVRNVCMVDLDTILAGEGYIDYICPQIYEGFQGSNGGFKTVYDEWSKLIKNPKIRMIAGMTFEYAVEKSETEWIENDDVIARCIEYMKTKPQFSGYAIFCYQNLFNPKNGERNALSIAEADNMIKIAKTMADRKILY